MSILGMGTGIGVAGKVATSLAIGALGAAVLTGCGSGDTSATESPSLGAEGLIGISLITKTADNPFFVSMQESAEAVAAENGVALTLASGQAAGDEASQIEAIDNAIAQGQQGILITPMGPGVNEAIEQARSKGLYVIALDTVPEPPDIVDITFATDNFRAGQLVGQWTAATLAGQPAVIAMLDLYEDRQVTVDTERHNGFLTGMGIAVPDRATKGGEAATGAYSGGTYTIACQEPTDGLPEGGQTAMAACLAANPNINVVYTANEPSAEGAYAALQAAGKAAPLPLVVSFDGGCAGVADVGEGIIGATAMQYPGEMARQGVEAIAKYINTGTPPAVTPGLTFYDTGVSLVTDKPVAGVESITSQEAVSECWGTNQ